MRHARASWVLRNSSHITTVKDESVLSDAAKLRARRPAAFGLPSSSKDSPTMTVFARCSAASATTRSASKVRELMPKDRERPGYCAGRIRYRNSDALLAVVNGKYTGKPHPIS